MKHVLCLLVLFFMCSNNHGAGGEKRKIKKLSGEIKKNLPPGWSVMLYKNHLRVDFSDSVFYNDNAYDLNPEYSYDASEQECRQCKKTHVGFELVFLTGNKNWSDSMYISAMQNNQKINAALDTMFVSPRNVDRSIWVARLELASKLVQLPVFKNCRYTVMLNAGNRKGHIYYYDVKKLKSAPGIDFNADLKKVKEMCLKTIEESLR